jgi:small GTP-binding protein
MADACKIVLVGDAGAGKTCIISRYVNNRFEKAQMSTACPSFCNKSVSYPEYNKTINIDIWDTAGQEIYRSISKLFYNGASIGILVYDISNKKSFESLKEYWFKELKENTDDNIKFFLVGNKIDLFESEQVKEEEAKEFAKSIEAGFFLTSAKSGIRINELFWKCGEIFIDPNSSNLNEDMNKENKERRQSIRINNYNNQKKGICC